MGEAKSRKEKHHHAEKTLKVNLDEVHCRPKGGLGGSETSESV
jgi:hypothetical protein